MKIWIVLAFCLIGCHEGPMGPPGEKGSDGAQSDLEVLITTGTIYNANYTIKNPNFASIHLPKATSKHVVLFLGIENSNGVYTRTTWSSSIYGGSSDWAVPGTSGYYILVSDPNKSKLLSNYKIKYLK